MMTIWSLLLFLGLLAAVGLALGWLAGQNRLRAAYARAPQFRWAEVWRTLEGRACSLDAEWRDLGYEPMATLLNEQDADHWVAVFRHPFLPIYGLISTRAGEPVACAMTFWEAGGTLITTAASACEARVLAVDTDSARLVQLRVAGRPLALDGQHSGTVRAWALGKRTALPATQEALIGYLMADYQQIRSALQRGKALSFPEYLRSLLGKPPRILTF